MDKGKIRSVWDDEGNHVDLKFLGNFLVRDVIFKPRGDESVTRVVERNSFN